MIQRSIRGRVRQASRTPLRSVPVVNHYTDSWRLHYHRASCDDTVGYKASLGISVLLDCEICRMLHHSSSLTRRGTQNSRPLTIATESCPVKLIEPPTARPNPICISNTTGKGLPQPQFKNPERPSAKGHQHKGPAGRAARAAFAH